MAPTSPAAQRPRKAATAKKASIHPSFKEMVVHAIAELKDRNGSTRQQIKKYIDANYKGLNDSAARFINQAIKSGVQTGELVQPKGPSGPVKLGADAKKATSVKAKKTTSTSSTTKKSASGTTAAKKRTTTGAKKSTGSKVAAKKTTTAAKSTAKKAVKKTAEAPKKAAAPKKRATPKAAAPAPKKDTGAADKARAARAAKRA